MFGLLKFEQNLKLLLFVSPNRRTKTVRCSLDPVYDSRSMVHGGPLSDEFGFSAWFMYPGRQLQSLKTSEIMHSYTHCS